MHRNETPIWKALCSTNVRWLERLKWLEWNRTLLLLCVHWYLKLVLLSSTTDEFFFYAWTLILDITIFLLIWCTSHEYVKSIFLLVILFLISLFFLFHLFQCILLRNSDIKCKHISIVSFVMICIISQCSPISLWYWERLNRLLFKIF